MEKCTCSKCKKLFFYDPKLVPYRTREDMIGYRTLYQKIMTCPYCATAFLLDKYYKKWEFD